MNLCDARILLLEDDAMISIDAEDMLIRLGAKRVLVAYSLPQAAALVGCESIDAAVLDVRIGDSHSDAFARDLGARRIPFIFASGYAAGTGLPADLQDVPTISKPYSPEALLAAFATLSPQPS